MISSHPVAAIDLGTNTCLLLIAQRQGDEIVQLATDMEVVRLGAGLDKTGNLDGPAMERALTAFRRYRLSILKHGCRDIRCVATAAFRNAENAEELGERIKDETGFEVEEIGGDEEARLVMRSVREWFPPGTGTRVVLDVGGGSTEIITEVAGRIASIESLPMGSVSFTERFIVNDPPAEAELAAMIAEIESMLNTVEVGGADSIIGVGGTSTTFVAMEKALVHYDGGAVHGAIVTRDSFQATLERCITTPLNERKKLPGLHPKRAEVIIAGGLIQAAVMDRLGLKEMKVCDRGLRWGVALQLLESQ